MKFLCNFVLVIALGQYLDHARQSGIPDRVGAGRAALEGVPGANII